MTFKRIPEYAGFAIILVASVVVAAMYSSDWISRSTHYYFAISSVLAVTALAKLEQFPFTSRSRVRSKLTFVLLMIIPLSAITAMVNSKDRLFWYPTDSGIWGMLPFFLIGLLSHIWKAPNFEDEENGSKK